MDSPLMILVFSAAAIYLAKLWYDDYRSQQNGTPNPKALPGAFPAKTALLGLAAGGALLLVGIETAGEYALGVSSEQTDITAIFLLAMIAAGFIEEVVFRGYLVIENKGACALWAGILGASLVFALLHYQYYLDMGSPEEGTSMTLNVDAKSLWSLFILFVNSVWFYSLRFLPLNENRSLLPCFVAHITSNLGVFFVKLAQGHVTSLW